MLDQLKILSNYFPCSLTIVDVKAEGRPCIFINERFSVTTGYEQSEVIGRNLSFLQGELTQTDTIDFMRKSFEDEVACIQDIINYKKDGTPFLNRLLMLPLKSAGDSSLIYVGFQNDITKLKNLNKIDNSTLQQVNEAEIRHMVNNPLTIILTSIVVMLKKSKSQDELDIELQKLSHIFQRINDYALEIENVSSFKNFNPYNAG